MERRQRSVVCRVGSGEGGVWSCWAVVQRTTTATAALLCSAVSHLLLRPLCWSSRAGSFECAQQQLSDSTCQLLVPENHSTFPNSAFSRPAADAYGGRSRLHLVLSLAPRHPIPRIPAASHSTSAVDVWLREPETVRSTRRGGRNGEGGTAAVDDNGEQSRRGSGRCGRWRRLPIAPPPTLSPQTIQSRSQQSSATMVHGADEPCLSCPHRFLACPFSLPSFSLPVQPSHRMGARCGVATLSYRCIASCAAPTSDAPFPPCGAHENDENEGGLVELTTHSNHLDPLHPHLIPTAV